MKIPDVFFIGVGVGDGIEMQCIVRRRTEKI